MEHQINCRIDTSDNRLSTLINLAMYYQPCQDVNDFYKLAQLANYYTQGKYADMLSIINDIIDRYIDCFVKGKVIRNSILNAFLKILVEEEKYPNDQQS